MQLRLRFILNVLMHTLLIALFATSSFGQTPTSYVTEFIAEIGDATTIRIDIDHVDTDGAVIVLHAIDASGLSVNKVMRVKPNGTQENIDTSALTKVKFNASAELQADTFTKLDNSIFVNLPFGVGYLRVSRYYANDSELIVVLTGTVSLGSSSLIKRYDIKTGKELDAHRYDQEIIDIALHNNEIGVISTAPSPDNGLPVPRFERYDKQWNRLSASFFTDHLISGVYTPYEQAHFIDNATQWTIASKFLGRSQIDFFAAQGNRTTQAIKLGYPYGMQSIKWLNNKKSLGIAQYDSRYKCRK